MSVISRGMPIWSQWKQQISCLLSPSALVWLCTCAKGSQLSGSVQRQVYLPSGWTSYKRWLPSQTNPVSSSRPSETFSFFRRPLPILLPKASQVQAQVSLLPSFLKISALTSWSCRSQKQFCTSPSASSRWIRLPRSSQSAGRCCGSGCWCGRSRSCV